jgi:hypothetical protein
VRASVGNEAVVERVTDPSLQRPDRFFGRFAFAEFAFVIGAARRVLVTDLSDRGDVDRMVELTVPAPRESVHGPAARGHLDGCGAVVGREPIPAREPANVAREPTAIVAPTGPNPNSSVTVVRDASSVSVIRWRRSRS